MISVRFVGSLGRIFGKSCFDVEADSVNLAELLKMITPAGEEEPIDFAGILIVVNGAKASGMLEDVVVNSGDEVTLIPIAHGG